MNTHGGGFFSLDYEAKLGGGLVVLPCRTTLVKLKSGGLWVFSPGRLDDDAAAEVDALGTVEALVAGSNGHNLHLGTWAERYPDAARHAAPDVPRRCGVSATALTDEAVWEDFEQIRVGGIPGVQDTAFFHPDSKTLLVTDVMTHVHPGKRFITNLAYGALGIKGKLAVSKAFKGEIKDKAAFDASIDRILAWDFDRVIVGHGDVLDSGGHAAAEAALRF